MNIPKEVSKLLENQDSSYAYKLLLEYLQGPLAFCWDLESITSYIACLLSMDTHSRKRQSLKKKKQ